MDSTAVRWLVNVAPTEARMTVPGRGLDVPLQWQHARVGARLLDQLTKAVLASAKQALSS